MKINSENKKRYLFVLLLIVFNLSIFAGDFSFDGKTLVIPDVQGYESFPFKQIDTQFREMLPGTEVKSVFVENNATTIGFDESGNYNNYFIIAVQPTLFQGMDITVDEFEMLKDVVAESVQTDFNAGEINSKFGDKMLVRLEDVSIPRVILNLPEAIGISSVTKFDGIDSSIANYSATVLLKGKIVWVYYYAQYSSFIDFENAQSTFQRFIEDLIQVNAEKLRKNEESEAEIAIEPVNDSLKPYKNALNYSLGSTFVEYSSENRQKAYGLEYVVSLPSDWIEKESSKQHIVHLFQNNITSDVLVNCNISVVDELSSLHSYLGNAITIMDYCDGDPANLAPKGSRMLNKGSTTCAGKDAVFCEYVLSQSILNGISLDMYGYFVGFLVDGKMVSVQFTLGGQSDIEDLPQVFDMYHVLFFKVLNSFKITGNDASVASTTSQEIGKELSGALNNFLLLFLIIPIICWTVFACILRFVIVRHSFEKTRAAIISVVVGMIVLVILYYTFDDLGALGSVIGTVLFYLITRIGHTEYDREMKIMKEQKEQASRVYADASEMASKAESTYKSAREQKAQAEESWREAERVKAEANRAKEKAENASEEIRKLEMELEKVRERNKRLEEEANRRAQNGTAQSRIYKDRSYYESVLGLSSSYTKKELRKAYIEKTALYHPDKVDSLGAKLKTLAEEEMKEINAAYSELQKYCIG